MAIGTAYVQGEDVAARGRVLLYSIGKNGDESESLVCTILFTTYLTLTRYIFINEFANCLCHCRGGTRFQKFTLRS